MMGIDAASNKMTARDIWPGNRDVFAICDDLRAALMFETRNSDSRLAAIRDPACHIVAQMIRPQPLGLLAAAPDRTSPLFVFEYAGCMFIFNILRQPVYGYTIAPLVRFTAYSVTSQFMLEGSMVVKVPFSSNPTSIRLGRIPDQIVGMHLVVDDWDSNMVCNTCYALYADGKVRVETLKSILEK